MFFLFFGVVGLSGSSSVLTTTYKAPQSQPPKKTTTSQKNMSFGISFSGFSSKGKQTWTCETCTCSNAQDAPRCIACDAARPSKQLSPTDTVIVVAPLSERLTEAQFRAAFGQGKCKIKALDFVKGDHAVIEYETIDAIEAALTRDGIELSGREVAVRTFPKVKMVIDKVVRLFSDQDALALAKKHGLAIQRVSWEDCARDKGSVWGPCISDMTLRVEGEALPVIRCPNFSDLTLDVDMDDIALVVGNERLEGKKDIVSLEHYLSNITDYLSTPLPFGQKISLARQGMPEEKEQEKKEKAVVSSQACFLPVPAGGTASFNVALYNYESEKGNPAVLAIVASKDGTSCQVLEHTRGQGAQILYANKDGKKCSFQGVRLSDDRKQRGVAVQGAMTKEEKEANMIMVVQVPLVFAKPERVRSFKYLKVKEGKAKGPFAMFAAASIGAENMALEEQEYSFGEQEDEDGGFGFEAMEKPKTRSLKRSREKKEKADVEEAIVRLGEAEGPFLELNGHAVIRDPAFPVRVTLQYYKTTSNGVVDESIMDSIAKQVKHPDATSLVTGDKNQKPRTTEKKVKRSSEHVHQLRWSSCKQQNGSFVSLATHQCNVCRTAARDVKPKAHFWRCEQQVCDFDLCAACMDKTGSEVRGF
jgi:hypothetical protein